LLYYSQSTADIINGKSDNMENKMKNIILSVSNLVLKYYNNYNITTNEIDECFSLIFSLRTKIDLLYKTYSSLESNSSLDIELYVNITCLISAAIIIILSLPVYSNLEVIFFFYFNF